jgi:hypothetical protein
VNNDLNTMRKPSQPTVTSHEIPDVETPVSKISTIPSGAVLIKTVVNICLKVIPKVLLQEAIADLNAEFIHENPLSAPETASERRVIPNHITYEQCTDVVHEKSEYD